jgi:hypothetical protein
VPDNCLHSLRSGAETSAVSWLDRVRALPSV